MWYTDMQIICKLANLYIHEYVKYSNSVLKSLNIQSILCTKHSKIKPVTSTRKTRKRQFETWHVSQTIKEPPISNQLSPLNYFELGLSCSMHIFRWCTTTVYSFFKVRSFIEEELCLHQIWTDRQGDSNITS